MSRPVSERLLRLKRLRKRMASEVALLDNEIVGLEKELRAAGFKPRRERVKPNARRLNKLTVAQAAEKVLLRRTRPMTISEFAKAIEKQGLYRTKSKTFYSTVAVTLMRDERFEKVERGLYLLVK